MLVAQAFSYHEYLGSVSNTAEAVIVPYFWQVHAMACLWFGCPWRQRSCLPPWDSQWSFPFQELSSLALEQLVDLNIQCPLQ